MARAWAAGCRWGGGVCGLLGVLTPQPHLSAIERIYEDTTKTPITLFAKKHPTPKKEFSKLLYPEPNKTLKKESFRNFYVKPFGTPTLSNYIHV
jgi:hypothetical protein